MPGRVERADDGAHGRASYHVVTRAPAFHDAQDSDVREAAGPTTGEDQTDRQMPSWTLHAGMLARARVRYAGACGGGAEPFRRVRPEGFNRACPDSVLLAVLLAARRAVRH